VHVQHTNISNVNSHEISKTVIMYQYIMYSVTLITTMNVCATENSKK